MSATIELDGHKLVYATAGSPSVPPLVMVHGWFSHRGVWRQTIAALHDRFYCVAIDLLSFGDSDKPKNADYSIPAQHLANITAPTLAIFGRQDAVVPLSDGDLVEQHVPGGRLALIDRCGHYPMHEQTRQYLDVLETFLTNGGEEGGGVVGEYKEKKLCQIH